MPARSGRTELWVHVLYIPRAGSYTVDGPIDYLYGSACSPPLSFNIMSISVDDLASSLSASHIGQEAIDLAALQVLTSTRKPIITDFPQ